MSVNAPVVLTPERYTEIYNNPANAKVEEQTPFLLAFGQKQNEAIQSGDMKEYGRLQVEGVRFSKAFNATKVDAIKNVRVPYMNEVVEEFTRLRDYFLGQADKDTGEIRTVKNEDGSVKEQGPLPYPVYIQVYIGAKGNLVDAAWTDQKSEKVSRHRQPGPRNGVVTMKDGNAVTGISVKAGSEDKSLPFTTKTAAIVFLLGEGAQYVKNEQGEIVKMSNGKNRPANALDVLDKAGYVWTPEAAQA